MRYLILFITLSLFYTTSQAQFEKHFSVHLGYHFDYVSPSSLNYVIDQYNNNRSGLEEEMKNIDLLSSLSAGLSYNNNKSEFRLQGLLYGAQVNAVGNDSMGVSTRRDLGLFGWTASLGLSQEIAQIGEHVSIRLGGAFSLAGVQTETKEGPAAAYEKDDPLDEIFSNVQSGIQLYVPVRVKFTEWVSFSAEPFYQLNFNGFDATEINKTINPDTWEMDAVEDVKGSFNYPGLNLALIFSI